MGKIIIKKIYFLLIENKLILVLRYIHTIEKYYK